MENLTKHLRQHQVGTVADVAGQVHFGMMAAIVIIMQWPDARLVLRYITGFYSLSRLERTGVLKPVDEEEFMRTEELLQDAQEVIRKLEQQSVRPGSQTSSCKPVPKTRRWDSAVACTPSKSWTRSSG